MAKAYYYTIEAWDGDWNDWCVLETEHTMEDGKRSYRYYKAKGYKREELRLVQNIKHYPSQDTSHNVIMGNKKLNPRC